MRRPQVLQAVIAVTLVLLFLVGCGGSASTAVSEAPAATSAPEQPAATLTPEPPTPTSEPPVATPTPTPIPPTPTPACTLKCNVSTERYGFEITCESGQTTTTMSDSTNLEYNAAGSVSKITVQVNQTLTYADSDNEYKVTGKIIVNADQNRVNYDIAATGGVFKDTPQICKSENAASASASPTSTTADTGLIKGLFPDDIVETMKQEGLQCDYAKISDRWYAWKCNLYEGTDWLGFVEFFSKSPNASVDKVEATALETNKKSAVEILSIAAAFSYTNAESDKAKAWVEQILPTIEAGSETEEMFGEVKYTLRKDTGAGWLHLYLDTP